MQERRRAGEEGTGTNRDKARSQEGTEQASAKPLVARRARLYIDPMNVAFELPPTQADKLQREADRLGVAPSDLPAPR
jgi:hypothetical protein